MYVPTAQSPIELTGFFLPLTTIHDNRLKRVKDADQNMAGRGEYQQSVLPTSRMILRGRNKQTRLSDMVQSGLARHGSVVR